MLDLLLERLAGYRGSQVMNQYAQQDPDHDLPDAPRIRMNNLVLYLDAFANAQYVLLAEAAGYQGCRFSGVPMTSEELLCGDRALPWARHAAYRRSSSRRTLWREPSATILWRALGGRADCLIWNTFPWHPIGRRGVLSNRAPRSQEIADGAALIPILRTLFPRATWAAIGRVAEGACVSAGMAPRYLRHPAHGGKPEFVVGLKALLTDNPPGGHDE